MFSGFSRTPLLLDRQTDTGPWHIPRVVKSVKLIVTIVELLIVVYLKKKIVVSFVIPRVHRVHFHHESNCISCHLFEIVLLVLLFQQFVGFIIFSQLAFSALLSSCLQFTCCAHCGLCLVARSSHLSNRLVHKLPVIFTECAELIVIG